MTILLPRCLEEQAEREDTIVTKIAPGGNETILVVEDDADLRETVVTALTQLGYRALSAPNADAALRILAGTEHIDLLFTDIMMPGGMLGPALAKRARELRPDIDVLFTTGYADNSVLSGTPGLTASEVIHKPYRNEELATAHPPCAGSGGARCLSQANKLLVIDDQPDLCEFISEAATGLGFETLAVTEPDAFRRAVQDFQPTVVVLDLQMPGADGIELLRYLGERGSKAQVLVASGMDQRVLATAQQIGKAQGLTMLGALQKPILLADLEVDVASAACAPTRRSSRRR